MAHSRRERNIALARSKWAKYSTFRRAGAKNISRHAPTLHAGAVFLSSQSRACPTGGSQLALLGSISTHAGQNSPSTHHPTIDLFSPAGRILSRSHPESTPAGQVSSRPRAPQPGPRSLRLPPHRRCLVAGVWLGASSRSPARPRHSPRASQISRVKPASPLLARARVGLKPPSPLRVRNGRF